MKKSNFNNQYNADPLVLFTEWFEEAKQKEINDPNAMNLATISKENLPSSRIVLLKSFDNTGFVFDNTLYKDIIKNFNSEFHM